MHPSPQQHPQPLAPAQPQAGLAPVAAKAKGAGQAALITVGLVLHLGWVVLPWCAARIVSARRAGEASPLRYRLGAALAAGQGLVATVVWAGSAAYEQADSSGDAAVSGMLWGFAAISALIVLGSGLAMAWAWLRTPSPARRAAAANAPAAVDRKLFDDSDNSRKVEDAVRKLAQFAPAYAGHAVGGVPLGDRMARVAHLAQELFRRLRTKGTEQQTRMAKSQYADILGKVVLFAQPDYLLDVLVHPELWHHPQQRVLEAGAALDAVAEQLMESIRQVNAGADLDFQVALASLNAITRDDDFANLYLTK